jgi:hypothetical protein
MPVVTVSETPDAVSEELLDILLRQMVQVRIIGLELQFFEIPP